MRNPVGPMPTHALAPLTPAAFAPFGEVFAAPASVVTRMDHVAGLQNGRREAVPNLFLARSGLVQLPRAFDTMERHPFSSQSFVPLEPARIVVAVALPGPDGTPDFATLQAFLAGSVGFSYRAGVWHLPVASLEVTVPVLGFMYEDGSAQDCVFANVEAFTLVEDGQSLARST